MPAETAMKTKKGIALRTVRSVILGLSLVVLGMGIGYQYRGVEHKTVVNLNRNSLDFSEFWEVWDTLQNVYVDPQEIDSKKMIYGAIQGMTAALGDPYTVYLPPEDNKTSKEDLNGQFDGVGIQLGYKKDTIAVQTPLENHPAIKAGVKAGDLILHIKDELAGVDKDTTGLSLQEAVKLIRGKKGTAVTITFFRENTGTFDKTIVRDQIIMPSVELVTGQLTNDKWEKSETGNIGWIKLYRFGDNTQEQWDEVVRQIQSKQTQIKGLVLDVRNNPGGLVQTTVSLASDFIPEGVIVKQQGKNDSETYSVSRRGRLLSIPTVVLINGGSASASEILAGALRDRLNVKLVGEKSFGKGTVQQAIDLDGGAGLHVTVAKWLLPKGDWIHEKGLEPTIKVELPDAASDSAEIVDTQLTTAVKTLITP